MKTKRYTVQAQVCCGCGACVDACQNAAITCEPGCAARIEQALCTACGRCAQACKLRAIAKQRGLWLGV